MSFHEPVLLKETLEYLVYEADGLYLDGTLGGGGHASEILKKLGSTGRLFGIDQDDEALNAAKMRIGTDPRFTPVKGNFGYMDVLLPPEFVKSVSGILLDLGVSSHQIDTAERGFSFQQEGPLDMRMGNMTGLTAYQVINDYEPGELKKILFKYGEERHSNRIVRAIQQSRPIETTGQLRRVVESVVKGPHSTKSVARVFQAVRIEVNGELDVLEKGLNAGLRLLKPGGRFVVISYHSLEDRIVKTFFKTGNTEGVIHKDFYGNVISEIEMLRNKIITASGDEIARNPRARSAKMRIGIKKVQI